MKGTGVPFTLIKCRTDHRIKKSPVAIMGAARMIFNDGGRSSGTPKNLSSWREATINSAIRVKKKSLLQE